jgi:hypothetical protein
VALCVVRTADALDGAMVVATDSGRWRIQREYDVQLIEYREALKLHQPDIVLCSWMPMGDDWTRELRSHPSVQEYILIGEVDEGELRQYRLCVFVWVVCVCEPVGAVWVSGCCVCEWRYERFNCTSSEDRVETNNMVIYFRYSEYFWRPTY